MDMESIVADKIARDNLNACMADQVLNAQESTFIETVKGLLENKKEWEVLSDDPRFPKWMCINEGVGVGKCTGVVQTSPENLLSWLYLIDSNQAKQSHINSNGPDSSKYPNKVVRRINNHHQLLYACRKLPPPPHPTILVNKRDLEEE